MREIAHAMLAVWHGDRFKALFGLLLASGGSKLAAGELCLVQGYLQENQRENSAQL